MRWWREEREGREEGGGREANIVRRRCGTRQASRCARLGRWEGTTDCSPGKIRTKNQEIVFSKLSKLDGTNDDVLFRVQTFPAPPVSGPT